MRKTYKYRIYPNRETEQKLYWTLTRCRELYNAALSERKDAYQYAGKSITYYDQQNDLPEIKAEIREEYRDIAAHVLQDVLRRLDSACVLSRQHGPEGHSSKFLLSSLHKCAQAVDKSIRKICLSDGIVVSVEQN
jgi:transposase